MRQVTWRFSRLIGWALVSGVALGVGVRLAMRFVALEACVPEGFSVGGSLEIVAATAIAATPLALVFLGLRRCLPSRAAWSGLLFGLGVFGVLALAPPPSARSALADTPDTPAATAAAFALCFAVWGAGFEHIAGRPPRSRPQHL
jgi:hypothetical protein